MADENIDCKLIESEDDDDDANAKKPRGQPYRIRCNAKSVVCFGIALFALLFGGIYCATYRLYICPFGSCTSTAVRLDTFQTITCNTKTLVIVNVTIVGSKDQVQTLVNQPYLVGDYYMPAYFVRTPLGTFEHMWIDNCIYADACNPCLPTIALKVNEPTSAIVVGLLSGLIFLVFLVFSVLFFGNPNAFGVARKHISQWTIDDV